MRDNRVDILRFIGLSMIILAHVNPPEILFQLRNFDVPLMVLVSGMAFGLSHKQSEPFLRYVWKRIKRLAFPVWVFLTGFFIVLELINPNHPDLSANKVITSYGLISGIGYVWIIRVFLLVALAAPFVYRANQSITSNRVFFTGLALIAMGYELVRYFSLSYISSEPGKSLSLISHYTLPYVLVFALGLRSMRLTNTQILTLGLVFSSVFAILVGYFYFINGHFVVTQKFKYPPSIYYFSYALAVAYFCVFLSGWIENILERLKLASLVLFIAQNSIWIYLWHIPFIKFLQGNFAMKYVLAYGSAVAITYIQVQIINKVIAPALNDKGKRNLRMVFTG